MWSLVLYLWLKCGILPHEYLFLQHKHIILTIFCTYNYVPDIRILYMEKKSKSTETYFFNLFLILQRYTRRRLDFLFLHDQ